MKNKCAKISAFLNTTMKKLQNYYLKHDFNNRAARS